MCIHMIVPIKLEVTIGKVGNSHRISIPKPIIDQLGLKKGDKFLLSIDDENRIIVEQKPVPPVSV